MKEVKKNNVLTQNDYEAFFLNGIVAPWYLSESQLAFYKMLRKQKRVVANCHRRFGKDTTVLVYAFERAHTEPIVIRYGAPTQTQAFDILNILFDHIYDKAPHLKPEIRSPIRWPSGARMHVFGVKDAAEADKARGSEADIIICSEYGFWRYKPKYILKSVLGPQLDDTDGQLFLVSTPPEDLTHPYIEEIAEAEEAGHYFYWPIERSLSNGDISPERHAKIIERCGGTDTDAYKREYRLDLVANRSRLVIPEAQEDELYQGSQTAPEYRNWMFTCDLGLKDFFAGLWSYVDFKQSRLIPVKELVVNYKSTSEIARECKQIEHELGITKVRRLGDSSDPQQLFDLSKDHDYQVSPIIKRSKMSNVGFRESVINGLRVGIQQSRILIDPGACPKTCQQLKYGIWNERRTDFERTETMGHLDALMALAYQFDNVDWSANPYPALHPSVREESHFIAEHLKNTSRHQSLKKAFGR